MISMDKISGEEAATGTVRGNEDLTERGKAACAGDGKVWH